jgi:chromosome segregation ATPase
VVYFRNAVALASKDAALGKLEGELAATTRIKNEALRSKSEELSETQERLCKSAEESGRLQEQLRQQAMALERLIHQTDEMKREANNEREKLTSTIGRQSDELQRVSKEYTKLEGVVELLQKQNEGTKAELKEKGQELLFSRAELTSTQRRLEEWEGRLDQAMESLQRQQEGSHREMEVKHRELLSNRAELANMRDQLRAAMALSRELHRTKAALLDSQTQFRRFIYVVLHLSFWLTIHLRSSPREVLQCLPVDAVLLLTNIPYLPTRGQLFKFSIALLACWAFLL